MKTITRIESLPEPPELRFYRRQRVAIYIRTSTHHQHQALVSQREGCLRLVKSRADWELAGIYADEGKSGASVKGREGFCSLMHDCQKGGIDLILTKSISRFARTVRDSLQAIRFLHGLGVGVYFELEGISTMGEDSGRLIEVLAIAAQEQMESQAANCRWSIRKRYEQGEYCGRLYGYRNESGRLVVVSAEADVVRDVYRLYLAGWNYAEIARHLNSQERIRANGRKWGRSSIRYILTNEKYKGAALLQKTCGEGSKRRLNRGELPKYYIEYDHEPIVSVDVWERAQAERLMRAEQYL